MKNIILILVVNILVVFLMIKRLNQDPVLYVKRNKYITSVIYLSFNILYFPYNEDIYDYFHFLNLSILLYIYDG